MRFAAVFAAGLLVLPAAAFSAEKLHEKKDWRYCSQDAQCVMIDGTCGKTVVNALAKEDAEAYYRQERANVKCAKAPFWKPDDADLHPRCHLGGCDAIAWQANDVRPEKTKK